MTKREAIEKIEKEKVLLCHGCMHPSMVGWCENYCQMPEAFDIAIEALEKQIPMAVKETTSTKRCGRCGRQLSAIGNIHPEIRYCAKCGQAIDWGEKEET